MTQVKQVTIDDAFRIGMSHFQNGQLKPALTLFAEIIRAAPGHADSHQMLGLIAFQTGQLEPAVKAMSEAVRLRPDDATLLTNFTEILRASARLDQAEEIGLRAVRLAPGNPAAHSNLGLVFYDQKKLTEAEASQERALALDPDFDRALNNLGSIARDRGDRQRAAEFYRKALKVDPTSSETVNNLASVLIEAERISEARAFIEAQLKKMPRDAELHRNIGRIFLLECDLDRAETAFRDAISLNPDKAESYVGLSQVLYEKNHPKLALIEAEQATRLDPKCASAIHQVATAKAHLGDLDEAISLYTKAMELNPDMTASRLALGHLELEQGNFETARQHFVLAAESPDDELSALIALAKLEKITPGNRVFLKLEASRAQAGSMLPQKAAAFHYALGECYEKLQRSDEAFLQFETGAKLKRSLVKYDAAETDRLTSDLINVFDKNMIDRLRRNATQSDRPIFVLGMPRSGTTLTESILNAHPQIFGAGELNDLQHLFGGVTSPQHCLAEAIASLSPDALRQRARDYVEALAKHAPDTPHIVDKMPANFQLVGLIHAVMPNAKIIHVARNPLDTCLSCYTRLFERSQLHSYDLVELGNYYNNYVRIMNHWREVLPENAFLTVQYETLIDDFETESRKIISYCGLEWDQGCLDFHKTQRRVRTASVQQVRQPLYKSSKAKWLNYQQQLRPLVDAIGETNGAI